MYVSKHAAVGIVSIQSIHQSAVCTQKEYFTKCKFCTVKIKRLRKGDARTKHNFSCGVESTHLSLQQVQLKKYDGLVAHFKNH